MRELRRRLRLVWRALKGERLIVVAPTEAWTYPTNSTTSAAHIQWITR